MNERTPLPHPKSRILEGEFKEKSVRNYENNFK
jgi:hypothetical protein